MWWPVALVALACGCRFGFDDARSTVIGDGGVDVLPDAAIDAPPGTRYVTFGERPTSTVKNVTTDSAVIEGFPGGNYGTTADMSVYGNYERGLLRFDLSSLSSSDTVLEAVLELSVEDSGDQEPGTFQVLRLDESWTEDAVTWTARDGGNVWLTPGGSAVLNLAVETVAPAPGPVALPLVTSEVQGWIDTPSTNHGMLMMSFDDGHWHIASREADPPEDCPQLRLLLQDP